MMKNQSIPEQLASMDIKELLMTFMKMLAAPEEVQRAALADILAHAENSKWGKRYHFADIHSVEEYRAKMPLTEYEQYREDIALLKDGEQDILYDGKTVHFLATSGSSGVPKYIPESRNGDLAKQAVSACRRAFMLKLLPGLMAPGMKLFAMSNPAKHEETKGGISVGSASGKATPGEESDEAKMLVLPPEFLSLPQMASDARDYIMILFAAAEANMGGIICNNPAHFGILMKRLNKDAEQIASDLEVGKISVPMPAEIKEKLEKRLGTHPERAKLLKDCLKSKKEILPEDLWKNLLAMSCWTSGSVGRGLPELKEKMPATMTYVDCGYGASEGRFNIPMAVNVSAGAAASFAYFFEFLPLDGGEPVCLWEAEDGKEYELIVTSYSGLYRYCIHDVVQIQGMEGKTPRIVFCCKKSDSLRQQEKTLYSSQLTEQIEAFEQERKLKIRHFEMCEEESGRLILAVEPAGSVFPNKEFAAFIRDAIEMNYRMTIDEIWIMKDGYRDSRFTRSLIKGKTVNQTKLAVFTKQRPPEEWRESID